MSQKLTFPVAEYAVTNTKKGFSCDIEAYSCGRKMKAAGTFKQFVRAGMITWFEMILLYK